MKNHGKEKEKDCICRLIDFERISAYTLENFENRMKNLLQTQAADRFWLQPIGIYINDALHVNLFYPQSISLYQLLHSDLNSDYNIRKILKGESINTLLRIKYEIALQLGRILLTIHNLSCIMHHGHLTSHNVFV